MFVLLFSLLQRIDLDKRTYDEMKSQNSPPALILAFTPWCGYCRALFPTWEKLTAKYKDDSDISIVWMNCTNEKGLCNEFGVKGYPSIFTMMDGKVERPVISNRNIDTFENIISTLKQTVQRKKAFKESLGSAVYPYFKFTMRENDNSGRDIAERACKESGLAVNKSCFFWTDKVDGDAILEVFTRTRGIARMNVSFTFDNVLSFIGDNAVSDFGQWNFDIIKGRKKLFALCITKDADIMKDVREWAKGHSNEVSFGALDAIGSTRDLNEMFNVTEEIYPATVFINMSAMLFYVVEQTTKSKLSSFLDAHKSMKIVMQPFNMRGEKERIVTQIRVEVVIPYVKISLLIVAIGVVTGYLGYYIGTHDEICGFEIRLPSKKE